MDQAVSTAVRSGSSSTMFQLRDGDVHGGNSLRQRKFPLFPGKAETTYGHRRHKQAPSPSEKSGGATRGHLGCEQQRGTARTDRCDTLTCDVVGGAVRGRADRKRETAEQRHTTIETHQLHRDLAL